MLVDEVQIKVKAGDGGDGKVNFHREKFVPKGGPDGGDGGKGGDFYIRGVSDLSALKRFRFQKEFEAEDGQPGGANKRSGANGNDEEIIVPNGTLIKDIASGRIFEIIKDEKYLVARGGNGGRGNWHFRSSTNQTPLEYEEGEEGEEYDLFMELQLIADFGLIGLPSVGKSSLLNELTKANVKTASYHFTTLEPNLGALGNIIIADLPGLIEGAHKGRGLGFRFLKHIKRTKIIFHCISCESIDPVKDYNVIRNELESYESKLMEKQEVILLTKTDLVSKEQKKKIIDLLKKKTKKEIIEVSIFDYDSIQGLKEKMISLNN